MLLGTSNSARRHLLDLVAPSNAFVRVCMSPQYATRTWRTQNGGERERKQRNTPLNQKESGTKKKTGVERVQRAVQDGEGTRAGEERKEEEEEEEEDF